MFLGSRMCRRSPSGGWDGLAGWRLAEPHGWRLEAEGVMLAINRRLSHQRLHMAAPHWRVKK
jgi:hypothetical protein